MCKVYESVSRISIAIKQWEEREQHLVNAMNVPGRNVPSAYFNEVRAVILKVRACRHVLERRKNHMLAKKGRGFCPITGCECTKKWGQ